MTAKTASPAKASREALLLETAAKHFHLEDWKPAIATASTFTMSRSGRSAPHWKRPSMLAKPQPAEQEHSHEHPLHHRQ